MEEMTEREGRPDDLVASVLESATPAERQRLLEALLREETAGSPAAEPPLAGIATAPTAADVAPELEPVVTQCLGTDAVVLYRYDAVEEAFLPTSWTGALDTDPLPVTAEDDRAWAAARGEEPVVVSSEGGDDASLIVPVPGIGALRIAGVGPAAISPGQVARIERVAPAAVAVADLQQRLEDRREVIEELRADKDQFRDFANIVSHDLRNPLSVARGYLDLAIEEGDPEYVEKVEEAHDRIEGIIEHTLALAEEGEQIGDTIPVDVETIARRAWEIVDTDDAALEVVESVTVDADPDRLQQCFENLFRNAVEHGTPDSVGSAEDAADDAPAVVVRVGALDGGFYVEDDGPGIPPERREEVFKRGVTGSEEGTGIGLDVVREIVEGHRWSIELTESEDGGARFEFRT